MRWGGRSIAATGFACSTPRFTSQQQKLDSVDCRDRIVLKHPAIALHSSFRFATLFELVLTKLLHEIH